MRARQIVGFASPVLNMARKNIQRGKLVATTLSGIWRRDFPGLTISAVDLAEISPLLLESGGAALGWRRVRNCDLRTSQAALQFRQAARLHTLRAAVHEREIKQIIPYLRSRGFEPLMGKGWAIARLYPEHGLRPYGDVDLYVHPDRFAATTTALRQPDTPGCRVDLHKGLAELDDRSFDVVYSRSQLVKLGDAEVRILGPEDLLRLLCLHTLRHGAWRPLWLCDIGIALESCSPDFDWDYFLSGNRRRTDWVACIIGLAHRILGVQIEDTPLAERAKNLPRWLVPTVLKQWGESYTPHGSRSRMIHHLHSPSDLLKALRLRWPNPIEATIGVRGPFNEMPRLPFQIGDALLRTAKFVMRAPRSLRELN